MAHFSLEDDDTKLFTTNVFYKEIKLIIEHVVVESAQL